MLRVHREIMTVPDVRAADQLESDLGEGNQTDSTPGFSGTGKTRGCDVWNNKLQGLMEVRHGLVM